MRCTPMLVVRDVPASSRWYQRVLELEGAHGGSEFEMLVRGGDHLLYLHHDDTSAHPTLAKKPGDEPGNGVLLYFAVEDVDRVHERALEAQADVLDAPHDNPVSHAREFSIRDPDGYGITVAQYRSP